MGTGSTTVRTDRTGEQTLGHPNINIGREIEAWAHVYISNASLEQTRVIKLSLSQTKLQTEVEINDNVTMDPRRTNVRFWKFVQ